MSSRIEAAEAYARAMRTGEFPAVEEAEKVLADDVKLNGATVWGRQGATVEGKKDVLYRISGVWPNTPVYRRGFWGFPQEEGDKVKIHAEFPAMGAAPKALNLTFTFNDEGKISVVDQEIIPQPRPEPVDYIPDAAKGLIDTALANDTPLCVAYVDENGVPNLSMRGSVQTYSPTEISIWVRNKDSGIVRAIAKNPNVGLLYRDNATRSTLVIKGVARIDETPEVMEKVWNGIQDVEQKHETKESGVAMIIDVKSLAGGTPKGGVRVQRS